MRVLLTSGIYPPDIGGPATFIPKLAKQLEDQNHQVVIVTLGEEDSVQFQQYLKVRIINRNQNILLRMLRTFLTVSWELFKSDAIFSNGLFLESAFGLMLFPKKNSVVKIVGDPVWERSRNKGLTTLKFEEFIKSKLNFSQAIQRYIYTLSWKKFKHCTSPSKELCEFVDSNIGNKSCIHIPNGVDNGKSRNAKSEFDLITVCRLVSWKNISTVIEAASALDLKVAVVGDGPEREYLVRLSKKINANVAFLGEISSEHVNDYLLRSRLFVQISDYEGLSFSLLEAMSCGVVPIVSNTPGNLAVINDGKNGKVVQLENKKEDLINAINSIISNNELFTELSTSAVETVRNTYDGYALRNRIIKLILGN
jgi:glycosyltransferase involved in cell wall biosynthesis